MNIQEAMEMIEIADACGHVPLITGKHGIGKSESPREYAKQNNMHFEPLILSLMDTGDLLGMPKTSSVGGMESTIWAAPSWFSNIVNAAWPLRLKTEGLVFNDEQFESYVKSAEGKTTTMSRDVLNNHYCEFYSVPNDRVQLLRQENVIYKYAVRSILFLDEFNRALVDVLNGSLQLILDHRLHSHELPIVNGKETLIIAAINPSNGNYTVNEFDPALMDRFEDFPVEVDFKAWKTWASKNNINKIVVDFLTDNQKKLHFEPADGSKGASPRSWVKVAKYLDYLKETNLDIRTDYIVATVGSSLAAQFVMYYNSYAKGMTTEKMEKLIKTQLGKKGSVVNPEEAAKGIEKEVNTLEAIRRLEFADTFIAKYCNRETAEEAMPMLVYLYALPLENLSSVLKNLQNDNIETYANLARLDKEANNKGLFLRIVSKIHK